MNNQTKIIKAWVGSGSINIFGRPFSGKDTQGAVLAELLQGELVAGGDILRAYPDQTQLSILLSDGNLIPSNIYLEIVLPYLSKPEMMGKPLVLSAVGRMHGEESTIMHATEESGHPMKAVVVIELSEQEIWQRFERADKQHYRGDRADDSREVLENRLKQYQELTVPAIEFYRNLGLVIDVDGSLSRAEVTEVILDKLAKRASE